MNAFYTFVGRHRNDLCVREVRDGARLQFEVPYKPTLYVPANPGIVCEWRTLDGHHVEPVTSESMSDAREFLEQCSGMDNYPVYGNTQYQYTYIAEQYSGHVEFDSRQIVVANIDIEVSSVHTFAKPDDPSETVVAITLKSSNSETFQVYGLKPYEVSDPNVKYQLCGDEGELLERFLSFWKKLAPDAVTGYNTSGYDIPYLYNRINRVFNKRKADQLSPFGYVKEITKHRFEREIKSFSIMGINDLDFFPIYRKNVLEPLESYRLDFVAERELGEKKLDYSEYKNLQDLYERNHQKFIDYNIHDVRLVDRLEAKRKLLELQMIVAYRSKCNMEDVMSQIRTWDAAIYNYLRDRKVVVPQREVEDKDTQYEGAYVMIPTPGLYKWIVSFDAASLYPSLVAALNIGVETKQDRRKYNPMQKRMLDSMSADRMLQKAPDWSLFEGYNVTMGSNGATYDKSRLSVFTEMIVELLGARKEFRKKAGIAEHGMEEAKSKIKAGDADPALKELEIKLSYDFANYDLKQKATKVLNNSLYGCVGNEFFRFYDTENAEAITVTGKFVIQFIARGINSFLNRRLGTEGEEYVVYADTDSNYICLDKVVQTYIPDETDPQKIVDFLDRVCKKVLEPEINRLFAEICSDYIHGNPAFLSMKREVIADKAIWTKKKRYILNIYDKEGERYQKPRLKFMGLEMKRSTTPKPCREAMKKCCDLILNGTQEELYEYVEDFHRRYLFMRLDEVAFPTGVNGLEKFSDPRVICASGCPMHVRAALMYNFLLKDLKLEAVYKAIQEGEKIKFVLLKWLNPINQPVIAFMNEEIPPEFELMGYVDYEAMYSKGFFEPMERIAQAAGWKLVRKANIEDLFT